MALTNAGANILAVAATGGTYTPFNNGNAFLGVGDNSAPFVNTQTDLQASSNKTYVGMDVGFPTVTSGNVMTFEATFGPTLANYTWNEWGLFNAASGGVMFNRKVNSLGTKINTQTWILLVAITINNP